ncbi:MAG: cytochrome C [Ignavibacteria bacterium RBG_16_34_14]|nr:MAG: cytochrome C [Ignavibacteria bacterium RBG_16_34_14]
MKKLLKVLGIIIGILVLLVIAGYIYLNATFPKVDPPMDVTVEITEDRLERGKYLAHHVTICLDCHSEHDQTTFSYTIKPGTEGKGGDKLDESFGFPGTVYMKNITPASLGSWSDGELIRAITCGVNKDGNALFPMMPYLGYNHLSQEDLYSIVAYIRSLKPIENKVPDTELNFPLNLIVKTIPLQNYTPKETVNKSDVLKYGKYLATIAGCEGCHTPTDQGEPLPGMDFAGGEEFTLPHGVVRSLNITPDTETGIGNWTKEDFIKRFKYYDTDSTRNIPVGPEEFNTVMPWTMFAGMTEEDLGAIYEYLRTIKPVKNKVERFTPHNKTTASK